MTLNRNYDGKISREMTVQTMSAFTIINNKVVCISLKIILKVFFFQLLLYYNSIKKNTADAYYYSKRNNRNTDKKFLMI